MQDKNIEKPLLIGNYANGGGEMAWAWWMKNHSKLAIIGSEERSPRKNLVKNIAINIHKRDPNAVYWITTNTDEIGVLNVDDSINWVEEFSDPPEEFNDRDTFISNRQFFSKTYFNLLAKSMGISRSDLMPLSSYKRHLEGPLMGYKRTIEELSDEHSNKEVLLRHLKQLTEVQWIKTTEGKKFILQETDNLYLKTLSLITAVWDFWAMTCKLDSPQQIILILDLPRELLEYEVEEDIQIIVCEALKILSYVSKVTTTSLILSSEMLYPLMTPELDIRFKLFLKTKDSDIDLSSPENRAVINPLLNELWDSGNSNAGYWIDAYANENLVVTVNEKDIKFWDDFSPYIPE